MTTSAGAPLFTRQARHMPACLALRCVALAALAGWAVLAFMPGASMPSICFGGGALAAISDPVGLSGVLPAIPWFAHWLAMVAAMMLPLALSMATFVEARSFPSRRAETVTAFLAGYGGTWLIAGLGFYALSLVALTAPATVLAMAVAVSFAWQFHPWRAQVLVACHRTRALAAHGHAATWSAGMFGLAQGARCTASCGHLMLPLLLGEHSALLAAAVTTLSVQERGQRRFTPRSGAALLALSWGVAVF